MSSVSFCLFEKVFVCMITFLLLTLSLIYSCFYTHTHTHTHRLNPKPVYNTLSEALFKQFIHSVVGAVGGIKSKCVAAF